MYHGFRSIEPVPFSEGKRREIPIPKKGLLRELIHVQKYDLGIAGGTGAGAVQDDPAFRTANRIMVQVEGGELTQPCTMHRAMSSG